MRVRSAILGSLSLVPVLASASCLENLCKSPPPQAFSVDEAVTLKDVDVVARPDHTGKPARATVDCKEVCYRFAERQHRGNNDFSIEACTLSPPQVAAEAGAAETPGRIVCAGRYEKILCEGRRPLGHVEATEDRGLDPLGRCLAAMAHLELASILAFEELAAWLVAHDAPATLVGRCHAAASDERRHARWLTALAERHGAPVSVPTARAAGHASAFEVALHNAVEGCVHESFAALMAVVRAERAVQPRLRQVFAAIAIDETRHGQLAWDVHAWLRARLDPTARRVVEQRQRDALALLPARARDLQAATPAALGRLGSDEATRLATRFATLLAA